MKLIKSTELLAAYEKAKKDVSVLDEKINTLYHFIEFESLDAVQMSKTFKILKQTLIERRAAKESFYAMSSLKDNLYQGLVRYEKRTKPEEREEKYRMKTLEMARDIGLIKEK